MSNAKTTADLFRERGWGVGTVVTHIGCSWVRYTIAMFTPFGDVMAVDRDGKGVVIQAHAVDGWSLYRPTPPVPTDEEWRELWAKLEAWGRIYGYGFDFDNVATKEVRELGVVVKQMKAKVQP